VAKDQLNALPAGYQLDDFTIESVLGAGGFGITYLAHERTLDRKVAIKEFMPRSAVRGDDRSSVHPISSSDVEEFEYGLTRFRDEAQTLVGFRHPNIVSVFRYIQANGTAYIVMEYVEGKSLDELLRIGDTLNESEAREILFPLLDGLEAVHAAGFLHRDIKPANIFIQADGMPVLLDFGAARHAIGAHSKSLTGVLTPGFAPFEQYATRGNQGPWTDIYALGATLYRAITGAKPPESIDRIEQDNYVPVTMAAPPGFSPAFLHAIDEALEMRAAERPQTVAAWRAMFLEDPAVASSRPPAPSPVATEAPPPADTIMTPGATPNAASDAAPTQAAKRAPDDAPTQAAMGRASAGRATTPPVTPPPRAPTKPAAKPTAAPSSGRSSGRAALVIGAIVVVVAVLAGGGYWAWSAYQEVERERIAADRARREAELARQRAEEARRRAEAEARRRNEIEAARRRAQGEAARKRAEEARRQAEEARKRAEEQRRAARGGTVQRRNYPGGRYEGTFVNGRRHGFGKYWWDTGDRFEGRWVNGNRTGFGKYWWANGNRYVGNFVRNKLSGRGTFYWRNGTRYVGTFVNGKFHGYGRIYWPSGARYFGQWSVGRRTVGTYWYPDGRSCRSRGQSCITAAR
jgi:serine/threonine protein kinase